MRLGAEPPARPKRHCALGRPHTRAPCDRVGACLVAHRQANVYAGGRSNWSRARASVPAARRSSAPDAQQETQASEGNSHLARTRTHTPRPSVCLRSIIKFVSSHECVCVRVRLPPLERSLPRHYPSSRTHSLVPSSRAA